MKKMILAVMYAIKEIAIKPEKNFRGFGRSWTRDIHAASVML